MAGSSSTLSGIKEYSTGVKILTISLVADDTDGSVPTLNLQGVAGKRLRAVVLTNSSTGFTSTADLSLTDSLTTSNLIATNGADIGGNSQIHYIVGDITDPVIIGNLTLTITNNIVNNAAASVYVVVF